MDVLHSLGFVMIKKLYKSPGYILLKETFMKKYKEKLIHRIKNQLELWQMSDEGISHSDVFRFLHSVVGTAPTIGLNDLGEKARILMNKLERKMDETWNQVDLQEFLKPLLSTLYKEEIAELSLVEKTKDNDRKREVLLLIDDDVTLLVYLKDELEKEGYIVIPISEFDRALPAFYEFEPDAVIIDIFMKDRSGLEVLAQLKDSSKSPLTPVLMISGDHSKEIRLKSYQIGADDFLEKPFDHDELSVRVHRQLERKNLIDQLILIDELTQVYNRKYLSTIYENLIRQMKRNHRSFSLAMIDLDYFKHVNDTYGHIVGDQVLKEFTKLLKQNIRENDDIIRYGGEEFLVIFPEMTLEESFNRLNDIREQFSRVAFYFNEETFYCTFSAGILEVKESIRTLEEVISLADSKLYQAKEEGRNLVKAVFAEGTMIKKKRLRVTVVDDDPIIRSLLTNTIKSSSISHMYDVSIQSFNSGLHLFVDEKWLGKSLPHLFVLDGMMPDMDGLEIIKRLRNHHNEKQFSILMLTSRNSEADIMKALQLGADDYMTKPFQLQDLASRLEHLLKN